MMKEYKVATRPFGFNNVHQKIEDFLNQYAIQGWTLVQVDPHLTTFIFEREKTDNMTKGRPKNKSSI